MRNNDICKAVALAVPSLLPAALVTAQERPNFLFVMLDDLAYDALESTGRYPFLETPNLTRLQNEGVTFDNFFCTMSLSSPSRASILTGVYPHLHGVNQNSNKIDPLWDQYPPYTTLLQGAGYESAFIGKMHNADKSGKDQIRPGFDYWFGFRGQGDYFNPVVNDNGVEYKAEGKYMTDLLTEKAVEWLTERRDTSRNFSLCLWHKAVHMPFLAAPEDEGKYTGQELPLPPNGNGVERFIGKPAWQKYKKSFDTIWEHDPEWNPHFQQPIDILETLLAVDRSMGVLYDCLDSLGILDSTVIIFTSDNGYFMGEHGFWDKRIAYEESMRVPMIIRWPDGASKGLHNKDVCINVDIAPTLLELAGVEAPDYYQGVSFAGSLKTEKTENWRDAIFYEYFVDDAYPYAGPTMTVIRTDRYKLVDSDLENDIDELYDLEKDPGEMDNLIGRPEYRELENRLRAGLDSLKTELKYNPDRDFHLREVLKELKAKKSQTDVNVKHIPFTKEKVRYGKGENNWMNIYRPEGGNGKLPVVFWAHPNSDGKVPPSADDISNNLVQLMIDAGVMVISWESVPQCKNSGDIATCEKDLEKAYKWAAGKARKYGMDMDNVFLSGASRGTIASWRFFNEHPDLVRGAYFVQALPEGAWRDPSHTPIHLVTADSPAVALIYREGMDTKNHHSPKYGKRIQDRYFELGIGSRVTLSYNVGEKLYQAFPQFIKNHVRYEDK